MRKLLIKILIIMPIFVFGQEAKITKLVFDSYFDGSNSVDLIATPATEIVVELKNDSIWRSTFQKGKQIGDFFRVEPENRKLFYHAKVDKKIMCRIYDMALDSTTSKIVVDSLDTKTILGFKCYKIKMTVESNDGEFNEVTSYEMYATSEIDLPLHALINLNHNLTNFFPLEMIIQPFMFDTGKEYYKIKRMD